MRSADANKANPNRLRARAHISAALRREIRPDPAAMTGSPSPQQSPGGKLACHACRTLAQEALALQPADEFSLRVPRMREDKDGHTTTIVARLLLAPTMHKNTCVKGMNATSIQLAPMGPKGQIQQHN